jgi:hypothetical protein
MSMLYPILRDMMLRQLFGYQVLIYPQQLKLLASLGRCDHLVELTARFMSFDRIRFLSVGISIPQNLLVESEKYTCDYPQV